jgi:hypothetical protein
MRGGYRGTNLDQCEMHARAGRLAVTRASTELPQDVFFLQPLS